MQTALLSQTCSVSGQHSSLDVPVIIYLETSHRDARNEYKDEEEKRQSTTRTYSYISSTALVHIWYSRHEIF